ncbi:hypothetical protein ABUK73_06310 [Agrobacterium sp. BA1120]|uniref:hypothetical protein n=1 Tax=Agrobacterium sp. BA1120 TaxID=3228927 RepID=UPI00336AAF03
MKQSGYGGEEWNGDQKRIWKGWRYFSSESKPKLDEFARYGHLGLIMTAMKGDVQYIVGVACDVSIVLDAEEPQLRKAFRLGAVGQDLWGQPSVKRRFSDKKEFMTHWGTGMHTLHWKCPEELYHWFDDPIPLPKFPLRADRMVLSKMHNSYQSIRPEDGLRLLGQALDVDHPVVKWIISSDFDPDFLNAGDRKRGPMPTKAQKQMVASAAAAQKPYVRYLKEMAISVNALHGQLENEFCEYLVSKGATGVERNQSGMDVCFVDPQHGKIVAELKPASEGETKFAIRIAIGQVLEYRHFNRRDSHPIIVLGSKPRPKELEFVISLGISCGWKANDTFTIKWAK